MFIRRVVHVVIACALLATGLSVIPIQNNSAQAAVGASISSSRIAGDDRYETAVAISKAGFKTGVPVVYIATGTNYPDALSAAPAAAHQGGPLLLIAPASVPKVVSQEIKRLKPKRIVVVGGTGVVSTKAFNALKPLAPEIKWIKGDDRYATSLAISQYAFTNPSTIYLATGRDFPDALSAGAAAATHAAPVLLTDGQQKSLRSETYAVVKNASKVAIVGGPSVVSSSIEKQLGKTKAKITRLYGDDRYATSVAVNKASFDKATAAYLGTGSDFPDALAGAALAGYKSAPLYVARTGCIDQATLDEAAKLGVSSITLLGGTAALTNNVQSLLACAQLAKPSISVMGGDKSLTVAWAKVPGVLKYSVEFSTNNFKSVKRVDAGTKLSTQIVGLKNETTYQVRVRAMSSDWRYSTTSAVKSVMPDAGYPRELKVTVAPAGKDQIKVSWSGQERATKVGVIAGSEGGITKHTFNSGWYPATATSITLTVPANLRKYLGTGSGNPIFVKVATYNNLSAGTSMPNTKNEAAAYRLSPAGSYTWAGATAPAGTALTVATWNVNSVAATADLKGYTWKDRRAKVAEGIQYADASLLATAELTTADAGLGNGKSQVDDLVGLIAPSGYKLANPIPIGTDGTNGAHLFYKTADLKRLDGGYVSPKSGLGISWPSSLTNRWLSWAKFETVKGGKTFIAAAVHLPANTSSTNYNSLRVAEAKAIDAYLTKQAGGLPIVVMGDFNSSFVEMPDGPQTALVAAGYYDTVSAVKRTNPRYSTANITRQIDGTAKGYPYRPYKYQYAAPRIDYIMVKNSPGASQHVNQLVLKDGKFDPAYQGSDHNLQKATIGLK